MKRVIAVDRGIITDNENFGTDKPAIVVKSPNGKVYAHKVHILDSSGKVVASIVYDKKDPENYGNKAWIETESDILIE